MKASISLFLLCGLFAGCSPNKGPATNTYLKAYAQVFADLRAQLKQLPPIKVPEQLIIFRKDIYDKSRVPPQPVRGNRGDTRLKVTAQIEYLGELMERCESLARIFGDAQGRVSGLNSLGVDPLAIQTIILREKTIGQRREVYVEMRRFCELKRDELKKTQSPEELITVLVGVAPVFLGDVSPVALANAVKIVADVTARAQAGKSAILDQMNKVNDANAEYQRDAANYLTLQAQLNTTVKASYPDQDWSFLNPAGQQ